MNPSYMLQYAQLDWSDGAPGARKFDDIYWHKDAALEEKQFVFIEPLKQLLAAAEDNSQITVCELGFGFANNCLLAADLWRDAPQTCQLNLISIESQPIEAGVLQQYLERQSFLRTRELLAQYPKTYRGQHVIWLHDNVRLVLILDEVESALGKLDADVDLWFLDGFSPAKNPDMWSESIMKKLFARSRPGAKIATYSAAGTVRRALQSTGFEVEKVTGFGDKREMLRACTPGNWQPKPHGKQTVTIVGAGLAGLYCAEALAKRDVSYQIIDRGQPGPSAIPQLSVLPLLAAASEVQYRFSLLASQYMRTSPGLHPATFVWRPKNAEQAERLQSIASGFPRSIVERRRDGSFCFYDSGWLSYVALRDSLQPTVITKDIVEVKYINSAWQCLDDTGSIISSDHVIVASGFNPNLLPEELGIRAIRGLAISVKSEGITEILNSDITIFPSNNGRSIISGTYRNTEEMAVEQDEINELITAASADLSIDRSSIIPHLGVRASARDRLPVIGTAPVWETLAEVNRLSAVTNFQSGLHYCTAFGSRGATHARLCAEHVVSQLLGEPTALDLEQQQLLSPARFVIRDSRVS